MPESQIGTALIKVPTVQTIAWFNDIRQGGRLNTDPPYQRRSFWNQQFRDFFIDTILNGYLAPPVYLHIEISEQGISTYHVVDGRQRLETIFAFIDNDFPVPDSYKRYAGKYFKDLPPDIKKHFWGYPIVVQPIDDVRETVLKEIFERINRNVAKLRPQELRHAKYSGEFNSLAESLSTELPEGFPSIPTTEKRRMADVEYVSALLLYLAVGTRSLSQDDIDDYYAKWDTGIPEELALEKRYRAVQANIEKLLSAEEEGSKLKRSRFRNRAEHYSLFAAIDRIVSSGKELDVDKALPAVLTFSERIDLARLHDPKEGRPFADTTAMQFYEAVRSASNDPGPRDTRITMLSDLLSKYLI